MAAFDLLARMAGRTPNRGNCCAGGDGNRSTEDAPMTGKKTAKEAKPATVFANAPGAEGDAEGHQRLAVRSPEQHPRQPDRPGARAQARQARNEPRPKQRPQMFRRTSPPKQPKHTPVEGCFGFVSGVATFRAAS